ncbi:hypothetical protein GPECTOR_72g599 [Gonium pectorale]|uniref:Protein kinase domain-containing protein n=1 Tax=Gonium pectorale TaxID=33097 RepID=A0A150G2Q5_GONPE|nr:hypothetical protein GPECTOR_72g599 [Gonium pectorale]|eukprot:KXZ44152.1 hypothetical protein GPECTOR_72g599 [Gonium pectorale]
MTGLAGQQLLAGAQPDLLAGAQPAELCPLPVTRLTPVSPGVNLNLQYDDPAAAADSDAEGGAGSEVQLLGTTLGAGAYGRVVLGSYRGERVAVKILNVGLCDASDAERPGGKEHQLERSAEAASVEAGVGAAWSESPPQGGATAVVTDPDAMQEEQVVAFLEFGATGPVTTAAHKIGQEVEVLARCQHPNVIRLLAASLNGPRPCLVMELMESSLDRMLYGGEEPRILPLPTVVHIALQVAQALAYLHPTILHRDLKPGNILVSQLENPKPIVKLADFGLSRLRSHTLVTRRPEVGTAAYMAPETFDVTNHTITDRADVYAFGVVLWEMLSGCQPWKGMHLVQVAVAINLHKLRLPMDRISPQRCPPRLLGIIRTCWDADPARRPAAAELVKKLLLLQEALAHSRLRGPISVDVL